MTARLETMTAGAASGVPMRTSGCRLAESKPTDPKAESRVPASSRAAAPLHVLRRVRPDVRGSPIPSKRVRYVGAARRSKPNRLT
jgi:hypothetical protein